MTDFDRRQMIAAGLGLSAAASAGSIAGPRPAQAAKDSLQAFLSVTQFGVRPDFGGDQTKALDKAIEFAAAQRRPLFFPAGSYRVTELALRPDLHMRGVAGRSVLIHEGEDVFLTASVADNLHLTDLVIDGRARPLGNKEAPRALLVVSDSRDIVIETCTFTGSVADGVRLYRCSGRVENCKVTDIADTGVFSIDAKGMEISHNHIDACGNNGIQVWREKKGEDATLILHNRIERIRTDAGGTGQNGNGIAVFRAGSVMVQGNRINDCAFSAIRANSASNVQMTGNNCARLGEVALYAEFAFEGAIIANNLVDGAAAGISITNFGDHGGRLAVAQGNLIRNLALKKDSEDERGYGIHLEADGVVSNNVIENAPNLGIALGWGASMRDITATGNIIRNARIGIGISVDPKAGYGFVTSNMISGAKDGGIRAMDHHKPLGPDLAKTSSESYRNIAVYSNVSV